MVSDASPPNLLLDQLYLEIPPTAQASLQHRSLAASFSTPGARWRASLNQICLDALLPWLNEEQGMSVRVWTRPQALSSFWEVVNGTAIECDGARFVLIPTDAIDSQELRIPQEWVDIPSWAADYYLAIQVNPRAGWLTLYGYTTHFHLKTRGSYDEGDRAYCLDEDDLIHDINVLWVARQLGLVEPLRANVTAIPALPLAQAENLLERLGNPAVVFPRQAVPFQQWAALLEHGGWRQQLYERRQGLTTQWSIRQWLAAGVSNLAQQWGWGTATPSFAAQGMRSREAQSSGLSRSLTIAGNSYELWIFSRGRSEDRIWRFELRSTTPDHLIPAGFKLRLLTEDLQPFVNNEDTAVTAIDRLYVDVILEPNEGIVWQIEPTPDDYDQEILRF